MTSGPADRVTEVVGAGAVVVVVVVLAVVEVVVEVVSIVLLVAASAAGSPGPSLAQAATARQAQPIASSTPRTITTVSRPTLPYGDRGMASIEREWVAITSATSSRAGHGPHPCQGLYHRPAGGTPKVACIATHYNVDFSEHYLGEPLAERGLGFLGWNTRYRGNEAFFLLEHALIDIGAGARWLREQAGVDTVVIIGNSGGADP